MIKPEKALQILREEGCSSQVIEHIKAVRDVSLKIAENISREGHDVNLKLVEIGAILHDIGRSKTHDISHGVEGAKILRERGLDEFASFAENHLGAGIPEKEAKKLDIPPNDYLPNSLEEKIVTYGDNLIRGNEVQSYEEALEELREGLGTDHPSLERFKNIHEELRKLGGFNGLNIFE